MILHSQFLTGHKFNQEPKKQRKKKRTQKPIDERKHNINKNMCTIILIALKYIIHSRKNGY